MRKKNEIICGIYKIKCKENNKEYIGQSINIYSRWTQHIGALKRGNHENILLQRAFNKYGIDSLDFSIIEICNKELLNEKEIYWISKLDTYNNGFNLTIGGESGNTTKIVCINTGIVYNSITEVENLFNLPNSNIVKCCKGKRRYCGTDKNGIGLVWRYYKEGMDLKYSEEKILEIVEKTIITIDSRKVICLNTKEIFNSVTEAEKKHNAFNIIRSCDGRYSYAGTLNGEYLQWQYYDEYLLKERLLLSNEEIENNSKNITKVVCLNDNFKIFDSIKECQEYYNIRNYQTIIGVCSNPKRKTVKSLDNKIYIFMYYSDFINKTNEELIKYIDDCMYSIDSRIMCIETKEVFKDSLDFCNKKGIKSRDFISQIINQHRKYKNNTYMYYKDYIREKV